MTKTQEEREMSKQSFRLRPEANPRELENLSKSQLDALKLVVDSLQAARGKMGEDGAGDSSGRTADPDSFSRVVLLTGEPGAGKTTVYKTLEGLLKPESKDVQTDTTGSDEKGKLLKAIQSEITDLKSRVVWLKRLDLEPLRGRTNFLAAVLARIERAAAGRNADGQSRTTLLSGDHDCMRELHRLQTDLALSWDSHVQERAQRVDPDTYATEIRRAEWARLDVAERMGRVIACLATSIKNFAGETPLFVLPVDDFYLDPDTTLDLLRLLRLLSVPHLFTILLGDQDTLEQILELQIGGDYFRLGGGAQAVKLLNMQEDIGTRARQLATSSLRKLIPPPQRREILSPSVYEALNFKWQEGEEGRSLQDVLGEFFVHDDDSNGVPQTLGEFLKKATEPPEESSKPANAADTITTESKTPYLSRSWTCSDILEANWRSLFDLAAGLDRLERTKNNPGGPVETKEWIRARRQWIGDEFFRALDESLVSSRTRSLLSSEMASDSEFGAYRFPTSVLEISKVSEHGSRFTVSPSSRTNEGGGCASCASNSPETLAPRPTAWLKLLHDFLVLNGMPQSFLNKKLAPKSSTFFEFDKTNAKVPPKDRNSTKLARASVQGKSSPRRDTKKPPASSSKSSKDKARPARKPSK